MNRFTRDVRQTGFATYQPYGDAGGVLIRRNGRRCYIVELKGGGRLCARFSLLSAAVEAAFGALNPVVFETEFQPGMGAS